MLWKKIVVLGPPAEFFSFPERSRETSAGKLIFLKKNIVPGHFIQAAGPEGGYFLVLYRSHNCIS